MTEKKSITKPKREKWPISGPLMLVLASLLAVAMFVGLNQLFKYARRDGRATAARNVKDSMKGKCCERYWKSEWEPCRLEIETEKQCCFRPDGMFKEMVCVDKDSVWW